MKTHILQNGLTLLELIVAMAVLAIITSLAAPAMTGMIRGNELRGDLNTLKSSIAFARTEAVSLKEQVALCATTDATSCATSSDWSAGWLIYVDKSGDGLLTTADCDPVVDCILRVQQGLNGQNTLYSSGAYLAFDSYGALATGSLSSLRLCAGNALASGDVDNSHEISVASSGSARVKKGAATCS
ncbi:GspH/FimT family pseudopilin [Agaribacterium sp. ZY112]|uniref:GspH/FimT family pseudopilin n=1 Tax=Agaribacterium sp. ZY112 TaxID=3233574 RepID=UPI00352516B1